MSTMNKTTWWLISAAVSAILIFVLIGLWVELDKQEIDLTQMANEEDVTNYLDSIFNDPIDLEPAIKIRTGIFIQSLKFSNSSEVQLTGYIWQHYKDGQLEAIGQDPGDVGFILPEQVNSGGNPTEIYRARNGDEEVIGWYFEATLRQPFDYSDFPFDHKIVWVRIWPRVLTQRVVLVPDFAAYKSTGPDDIFGIEKSIVLGTWVRENTYFNYQQTNYSTNFGLSEKVWKKPFPELHYNFILKRKLETAFIIYLLPLFLVATLLFAALLTISTKENLQANWALVLQDLLVPVQACFL